MLPPVANPEKLNKIRRSYLRVHVLEREGPSDNGYGKKSYLVHLRSVEGGIMDNGWRRVSEKVGDKMTPGTTGYVTLLNGNWIDYSTNPPVIKQSTKVENSPVKTEEKYTEHDRAVAVEIATELMKTIIANTLHHDVDNASRDVAKNLPILTESVLVSIHGRDV